MRHARPLSIFIAASGILLASLTAHAQFPGGGFPGGGPGGTGGASGPGGGRGGGRGGDPFRTSMPQMSSMTTMVQTRLAELKSELNLAEAQRPAWDAYAERVLRLLDDILRIDENLPATDTTGPQRLDRLADVARNRLTAVEDVVDAGKRLYAALTPAQRSVADAKMASVAMPIFGAGMARASADAPREH